MNRVNGYYEYQGSIHIHTTDSDGARPLEEVAQLAAETDLDFIMVSDHMTLRSYQAGKEGYYGKTLTLIGYEHNDVEDCNHYLLFDLDEVLPAGMTAQEYVAAGKAKGGLGIIAHPDEVRPRIGKFPSYPWLAWDAEGYDGIEIWNQMSEWMENLTPINAIKMLFSPRKFMKSPTDRILQIWDDVNKKRKVVGIGGADVHAHPHKIGPIKVTIFPYKVQFRSIRSYIWLPEELSKDVATAKRQVYDAIRDCRVFISNYRWGDASGFWFEANREEERAISGGRLSSYKNTLITVKTPGKGKIRLYADGICVSEIKGDYSEYRPMVNGLYRVEVYKKSKGWIFSNHIRIGV